MARKVTKRKQQVQVTIIAGSVLVALLLILYFLLKPDAKPYVPGEEMEGLSNELLRNLPPDYPKVQFTNVSGQAGIHFRHFNGERGFQLPEDMGSGVAWGDYNNDGWPDLFLPNFAGPVSLSDAELMQLPSSCSLYRNNGDGTFTDVSKEAGLDLKAWANAASWADYDNDGHQDLFITTLGENKLFHNNGNGTFTDISDKAGIKGFKGYWAGVTWGDYNLDGFLDAYVCGYVKYTYQENTKMSRQYDVDVPASINPSSFPPERNLLFRNNNNGTFTEVAKEAGVLNEIGRSLSAVWCDMDEDGWPDLYVANDVSDNVFYKNQGNGKFKDISHNALVADYRGAMGIGIGDWDCDTDFDMFVTHWMAQENALYNNLRSQLTTGDNPLFDLRFMDEADRYGLGQIALDFVGWATFFIDYDNDGRLDIFVVNGSTFQMTNNPKLLIPMNNHLFWNRNNQEGFYEVGAVSGSDFKVQRVGRGGAFADYDRDGDLDIIITNNGAEGVLLRNDGGNTSNWLCIQLEGNKSNKDAIGARLRLSAGDIIQVRAVGAEGSYFSQNSRIQHFGLRDKSQADTLKVIWPNGKTQRFINLPTRRFIKIKEGQENYIAE